MSDFLEKLYEELGSDELFFVKIESTTTNRINGTCWYCGDRAIGIDHVVPVCFLFGSKKTVSASDPYTVPCCQECNNTLNDKIIDDLVKRREFILKQYKKKYKALLKQRPMNFFEFASLGYNLQTQVASTVDKQKVVRHRMVNLSFPLPESAKPIDYIKLKPLMWSLAEFRSKVLTKHGLSEFPNFPAPRE